MPERGRPGATFATALCLLDSRLAVWAGSINSLAARRASAGQGGWSRQETGWRVPFVAFGVARRNTAQQSRNALGLGPSRHAVLKRAVGNCLGTRNPRQDNKYRADWARPPQRDRG